MFYLLQVLVDWATYDTPFVQGSCDGATTMQSILAGIIFGLMMGYRLV